MIYLLVFQCFNTFEKFARGNLNLSQRIEQQADSLQQSVASMEEITGTVQQNADNAKPATRLAIMARFLISIDDFAILIKLNNSW
jgi:methyl-accepting chemotaxis protein